MEILTNQTQDVKPFTRTLEGRIIIIEQPCDLWPEIETRLADGGPFQTLRGAHQKYELLAKLGEKSYMLAYFPKTKILWLRVITKADHLGSIEVARRIGRGRYEILSYQEEFDRWLDSLPMTETETERLQAQWEAANPPDDYGLEARAL